MSNPLVSVCCITYNHAQYISEAIESFLAQQCDFEFEIIIGEDKSTDNTAQIIESFRMKLPDKIKIVTSDTNVGMMKNLFRVLDAAKGKYIALCEGDDYWSNQKKLQLQVDMMEQNPNISLVTHDSMKIDAISKKLIGRIQPFIKSGVIDNEEFLLKLGGVLPTASMLFRQEFIKQGYPKFLVNAPMGDLPLTLWMGTLGEVFYINEAWSIYRVNVPGSWVTIRRKKLKKEFIINDLQQKIDMYKLFNQFSKLKYHYSISEIIGDLNLNELCVKKEHLKLLSSIKKEGLYKIIFYYIINNFSGLLVVISRIKRKLKFSK